MSVTSEPQGTEVGTADQPSGKRPTRLRLLVVAVIVVALAGAGVAFGIAGPLSNGPKPNSGVVDNSDPTSLATVARQSLSSQTQVSATLGYAGSYSVVNQAQGTITSLPSAGQVVSQGHVLYQVNGSPVVLLYGSTPAYRSLSEGASATDVEGHDVEQLNADLVALGYVTSTELSPTSDEFGYWTKVGVEDLQAALGVTQNGTLTLGQVVFVPSAARVTAVSATLGAPAAPGQPVLTATSTARQVSIDLDAAQQSQVAVGDRVTITLPNDQTTPGVISSVGTVATAPTANSSNSSPTITVLVNPTDPAATGTWDQAPVEVSITTGSVKNALVVPVDALLALAGGGYGVEAVGADGIHHLVDVSLGLFDDADGLVQVSGSGLAAGQKVVVPAL
jgi:HlyD family secretion protein